MKLFLTSIIFLLIPFSILSQSFTKAQMIEGLTSLRNDIKTYNPALQDYNPSFDKLAEEIIASVDQESYSALEHFKLITEMCAISNEGHFALGSWSDTPHKGFAANTYKYLPLSVKVVAGKLYAWNDYSNENKLKKGDEILSINNQPTSDIINQLVSYTESDGNTIGYAHRIIQSGFNWRYYLYIDTPNSFDITYKAYETNEKKKVTIKATTNEVLLANYKAKFPNPETQPESISDVYELNINEQIAILKLKSFTRSKLEKYKLKSTKFYSDIFKSIADAGVGNLVVDLRSNSGGRKEFANDMVPFILQQDNGDPYLRRSISWGGKEKTMKLPKKNSLCFQGNIYVVVNAETFSAASSLARFLKEYGNATVIGQETGTRYEGFSAGSKQYVSIPHSDIQIGIPRYQTIYPESKKQTTSNRGLIPDQIVTYTIQDIIDEKDLEMEFLEANFLKK